jgi:hypothetical protein
MSTTKSHGIRLLAALFLSLIFAYTYFCCSTIGESYKDSNIIVKATSQSDLGYFRSTLSHIVNESQQLTKSYQDEIRKWTSGQYDNYTLISITNSFLPKFDNLISNAKNMTFPNEYNYVHKALVNSLSSETESYKHFRNYLLSGNKTEDNVSTDLLSKAFQYEQIYSKFLSMPFSNPHQIVTKRINYNYWMFYYSKY